jgi:5-carboxymethyl-2-hydroxymuconate isomerase
LRICGHSKGGNLSEYASAFCDKRIQKRIIEVYNNDGPGFRNEIIVHPSFLAIADRIHTFIPQSSIVGMLFEHEEKYTVVESVQKGLMQHDLFSWQVTHNDVVRVNDITSDSKFVDKTLKEWLGSLHPEQRKELVNHLYEILTSTNAETLQELTSQWMKTAAAMIKTMSNMDANTKKNLAKIFSILVKAATNNINYILPDSLVQIQKHSLFQQLK